MPTALQCVCTRTHCTRRITARITLALTPFPPAFCAQPGTKWSNEVWNPRSCLRNKYLELKVLYPENERGVPAMHMIIAELRQWAIDNGRQDILDGVPPYCKESRPKLGYENRVTKFREQARSQQLDRLLTAVPECTKANLEAYAKFEDELKGKQSEIRAKRHAKDMAKQGFNNVMKQLPAFIEELEREGFEGLVDLFDDEDLGSFKRPRVEEPMASQQAALPVAVQSSHEIASQMVSQNSEAEAEVAASPRALAPELVPELASQPPEASQASPQAALQATGAIPTTPTAAANATNAAASTPSSSAVSDEKFANDVLQSPTSPLLQLGSSGMIPSKRSRPHASPLPPSRAQQLFERLSDSISQHISDSGNPRHQKLRDQVEEMRQFSMAAAEISESEAEDSEAVGDSESEVVDSDSS